MAVKSLCILIALIVNISVVSSDYIFPEVSVEVLTPRGFQVSIPDSPGVQLFAFHGNINEEMVQGLEAGQFSVDINRKYDGRWTYTNPTASLNPGDTLYFWTYVIVDGRGYQKLFQQFTGPLDIDPRIWTR